MKAQLTALPLVVLSLAATGQSTPKGSLTDTLVGTSRAFMDAWQKQDMKALSATLAPDFVYLGPEGVKRNVAADLAHCTLTTYSLDDVQLHQTSPTSATIFYKLHQQATCEGHPLPPEMLAADTYVRRDGHWQLSWTMLTPLMTH